MPASIAEETMNRRPIPEHPAWHWCLRLVPSCVLALGSPAFGMAPLPPYGPALQGDALANTVLGKWGIEADYRFRAAAAGDLRGIRVFFIWSFLKGGYHGGTGGSIKVELQEDDGSEGHLPSGKALASCLHPIKLAWDDSAYYPFLVFDRPVSLREGALYHCVFTNTDPDPERNFVSLNAIFLRSATTPRQPRLPDADWAMLMRSRGQPAWSLRRTPGTAEGFTPIMEVAYANGAAQGVGYMEFWVNDPKPISGPAAVREVFTVTGPPRRVTAVRVRVKHLAGEPALAISLETGNGTLLASGEARGTGEGSQWTGCAFPAPVTLASGSTYRLVLQARAPSRFEAFPMRKGSDKGFGPATVFGDGHAEFTAGRGWSGWDPWLRSNRLDSDLAFFFIQEGS
jgi:hypothetical protein